MLCKPIRWKITHVLIITKKKGQNGKRNFRINYTFLIESEGKYGLYRAHVHILNVFAVLKSLISFFNIIRTHFIVWRIYSLFPINACAKKGFSKLLCCVVLSPCNTCFHTNVYENKKVFINKMLSSFL